MHTERPKPRSADPDIGPEILMNTGPFERYIERLGATFLSLRCHIVMLYFKRQSLPSSYTRSCDAVKKQRKCQLKKGEQFEE